jgi:hypothetical protein
VLLLGTVAFGLLLAVVVADVGRYLAAGVNAATAADAAALAAAPVTFRSFGSGTHPRGEAARYAGANGAALISCVCPVDRSWRKRVVEVVVETRLRLSLFGHRTVRAIGRAEFVPTMLR